MGARHEYSQSTPRTYGRTECQIGREISNRTKKMSNRTSNNAITFTYYINYV